MSREYVLKPFQTAAELRIEYAKELNPQQLAAVTAPPGPALVIAGAGAGKTRTLTYRVAYLIEQGVPLDRILLLTFTNKAAKEMMRRVADLLGSEVAGLWGGTFHSVGARLLRSNADVLGYPKNFTILDQDDSKDLVKVCLDESKIETKESRFPKPDVLQEIFSLSVNCCKSVHELLSSDYGHCLHHENGIQDVFRRYGERKKSIGAMDFDDLLRLWLHLLRNFSEVRERYQRRFQFILVDEYQDTNRLQSDMVDLLAEQHQNVMVVGDDSQSIYSWRGANFQNILQFPKRYPKAQVYKIEMNYRSTPEILRVANAAIAPNIRQFAKELTATRASGVKPALVMSTTANDQAAFVAQRALELRDEGIELKDMAVLYRSHFHTLELQLELTRQNIPFSITSGIRFFEQAHIKDVAAYLKLICNPRDELAFKRIVCMLPGIGAKAADRIYQHFVKLIAAMVASPDLIDSDGSGQWQRLLMDCLVSVPKKAAADWDNFAATMAQLEALPNQHRASEAIRLILEAGYEEYLQEEYPNYRNRLDDLEQLAGFARQFESIEDFLTQLALLTNVEAGEHGPRNPDDDQIRLSTIHQAKGLEFGVVFVIMLCDGLFPSSRSIESEDGEEEERRLFYVSITRAKDELYLCYPLMRFTQGYAGDFMQQPSRFLAEIPHDLLDEWTLAKPQSFY